MFFSHVHIVTLIILYSSYTYISNRHIKTYRMLILYGPDPNEDWQYSTLKCMIDCREKHPTMALQCLEKF